MAQQLWFLRHAEAQPQGKEPDWQRRLTDRGIEQARAAGSALGVLADGFDAAFASPRLRALQTAELACENLGIAPVVHDSLSEGFNRDDALALLAENAQSHRVLLVGHEPDFSETIAQISGARVKLKKGGVAVVSCGQPGELLLLLGSRELMRLSAR